MGRELQAMLSTLKAVFDTACYMHVCTSTTSVIHLLIASSPGYAL